ncbi:hypothetical protein [Microbispora rosea]|nr:hypothetical protein [Microbispora rosea]
MIAHPLRTNARSDLEDRLLTIRTLSGADTERAELHEAVAS